MLGVCKYILYLSSSSVCLLIGRLAIVALVVCLIISLRFYLAGDNGLAKWRSKVAYYYQQITEIILNVLLQTPSFINAMAASCPISDRGNIMKCEEHVL